MQRVEYINKTEMSDFFAVEAFKNLRMNIQLSGTGIQTVLITSTVMSEGKSSCSYHLAKSFAELGKRVLLVDCDLRKSYLPRKFYCESEVYGLSHFLTGMQTLDQCICETDTKNLHIIFSGMFPPNPAELLSSKAFDALMGALKKHYDYIILDTPPLGSVIDAAILAQHSDGVVMVIRHSKVKARLAQKGVRQLERTGCKTLGVVLNGVPKNHKDKYYGEYYVHEGRS